MMKYIELLLTYLWTTSFISAFLMAFKAKPVLDSIIKMKAGNTVINNLRLVGVIKLVLCILFLLPATMHIGFFLLCSWFGGAAMIHITGEDKPWVPFIFIALIWISAYLRDPLLFNLSIS